MRSYRKVDDHFEIRMDGGRLVLLGVGAALVLVLVFLLGMLVGKGLWGGRRPAPLPLAGEPGRPPTPPPEAEPKQPPKYTFYEDLKKPDEPGPSADEPAPVDRPAAPPALREEPAPPAPEPVEKAVPPAPAPKPREPPPSAPAEPKLPAPVFTVQVGSFRDGAAAETLVRRVRERGISAQVVKASVAGRTWYRVQVGRFETRSEAERHYRTQLKPQGIQGFVTTR